VASGLPIDQTIIWLGVRFFPTVILRQEDTTIIPFPFPPFMALFFPIPAL